MRNTTPSDDALALSLAAEIRAERARRKMTQQQVWTAAGMSKSAYLKLESGEKGVARTIGQLLAVARALGVNASELMERTEANAAEYLDAADGPNE